MSSSFMWYLALILLLYSLPEISIVIHYIYFTGAVAFQKKSLYEKTHKIPMKYKTLLDNKLIEPNVFAAPQNDNW